MGFRYFVYHWAVQLRLKGDVRNLSDGDVEIYAVGTFDQLEQLKEKLKRGPAMAQVTHVDEAPAAVDPKIRSFHIEGG